ncbi:hypothetical protein DVT68_14840 [Dyella solisilvae]|uniref:Uncharacterized protein n=1 Tax=Dyella solisilvae TaxID=1920168 RepID=A0A370K6C2_9GAMM|nr:hypothetical protein DVT68_14840 [Dyella solisilvae]
MGHSHIDLTFLQDFPEASAIVKCLLDLHGGKRSAHALASRVQRYLRFVVTKGLDLSAQSLTAYRDSLDSATDLGGRSRQGYYSIAASFVRELGERGIGKVEKLPLGFRDIAHSPYPTFTELASNWDHLKKNPEYEARLELHKARNLDKLSRDVLVISELWMETLEDAAWESVCMQIDDWSLAESVVERSRHVTYADLWDQQPSIEAALGLLYQTFGRFIPTSPQWPPRIVDYCKGRGWPPTRLKGAFFPTIKSLSAFLVLALANGILAPNVDSVARYAFVGCVSQSSDKDQVLVRLGKFRGHPIERLINPKSRVVVALKALEATVVKALDDLDRVPPKLKEDGGVPLFLHYFPGRGGSEVRVVPRDHPPDMVRRFIASSSTKYPVLQPLVSGPTGVNFRCTHLLCQRLRGGSIFDIQSGANHRNVSTTVGYLERVEVAATARMVQFSFQAYLVSEARAARLRRLGNGFHCDPSQAPRENCLRMDLCSGCKGRKIVFIASRIVAEWLAWKSHIELHEDYLRQHRPERWSKVWSIRLVEYRVLLAEVPKRVLREAEKFVGSVGLLPLE